MQLQSLNYSTDVDIVIGGYLGRVKTRLELKAIVKPADIKKFMEGKHKLQIVITVDGAQIMEASYLNDEAVIIGDNVSIKSEIIE